jgi:hypothetical protein
MTSRRRSRSPLAFALGLALALTFTGAACGPKQKFCPDAALGDGVCVAPVDAPVIDTYEAPTDQGSIFIGADGNVDSGTD